MAELRRYPFCEGEAETRSWVNVDQIIDQATGAYIDADTYYYEQTGCPVCDIWFCIEEDESEDTTIKKWNRRVGDKE